MGRMVFRRNSQNHQSLTPLDWRSLTKDTVRLLRRQVTHGYAGSDTLHRQGIEPLTVYTQLEWQLGPNPGPSDHCQGVVTTVPLPPVSISDYPQEGCVEIVLICTGGHSVGMILVVKG